VARQTTPSARIRIVVGDGLAIDRGGLVGLLDDERDFDVVGEAATLAEAIQQCRVLEPDILLLSLNIPGQEQDAAIPAIRAAAPRVRIVALSERGGENCLVLNPPHRQRWGTELDLLCASFDCLQLAATQGATATVRRSAEREDLFRAIRRAAAGEVSYDPTTASGTLIATGPEAARAGAHSGLSAAELKVAAQIADGRSNKEIATVLEISAATVKKHVGHILGKLGLADRLQAGLMLARNPLILKQRP